MSADRQALDLARETLIGAQQSGATRRAENDEENVHHTELQTHLWTTIQEMGIRIPLDTHELIIRAGEHLQIPIYVRAKEFATAQASGVAFRLSNPDRYLIGYQAAAMPGHQAHIIHHELVHILRGHLEASIGNVICRGQLGTEGSTNPKSQQMEWEAEAGATILSGWSNISPRRRAQGNSDHRSARFASILMGASWA